MRDKDEFQLILSNFIGNLKAFEGHCLHRQLNQRLKMQKKNKTNYKTKNFEKK